METIDLRYFFGHLAFESLLPLFRSFLSIRICQLLLALAFVVVMVLIFVKQNDADVRPRALKVEAGQIINLAGLDALVVDKPSKEDLVKGMTKQQMLSILHGLGMHITYESKAPKSVIADLLLKDWDNKIMSKVRAVSSQPASSDDPKTLEDEDSTSNDDPKTSEDEDSTSNDEHETQPTWTDQDQKTLEMLERLNEGAVKLNYHELLDMRAKKDKFFAQQMSENYDMEFLDFIGITVDEWEQYAKAPNDFFENAFLVEVFDNSGDTLLLKLEADKGATDAKTFKEYIYQHVENIKKSKGEEVAFGISDFNIARGAMNYLPYKDYNIIDGNKVFINLKLRGGVRGLPVQKTVAKKKNQSVPVPTTRDDATVFQNAFTCALNISTLTSNITLSMLLDYLTVVQMKTLLEKLKHGKENTAMKVESFAEVSPAWKQLEQAETKITSAKNALKQTLFDDIAKVCTMDGKFKKSELVKKLEIAIAVREKSIAPSDVLMSEGAS